MIIHNPVITGSLQVNGSSVSSIESLDSTSGSVAALNNATSSYALQNSISGSFTSVSESLADRLSTAESELGNTLISGSAQIATEISGSFTSTSSSLASELLKNTTDTLTGDLTVTGTITAQEFHTEFVSASIIYESGSTQFGDSDDDTHIFTGDIGVGTDDPYSDVGYTSVNVGGVNGGQFIISSGSGGSSGRFLQISSNNVTSDIQTIPNIPLRFLTATTEKMRIQGDGNVGIGTDSSSHRLEIKGISTALTSDTNMRFFIDRSSASYLGSIIFTTGGASTSNGWAEIGQTDANGDLYFKANASAASYDTRMVIKGSNGRVGIGTTSPAGDLEISGSGASLRTITFNPSFNDDISISSMGVDANNKNAVTIGQANSENNSGVFRFHYAGAGSTNNYIGLGFYANDDKLLIKANGSVGIGTTSPVSLLHVYDTGNSVVNVTAGVSNYATLQFGSTSDNTRGAVEYYTGDDSLRLKTGNNSEVVRIESSGNMGIGTAYPSSSLHIYDNTASRLTVGQYGAPHYTQSGMAYQVIRATANTAARALLELHSGNQLVKGVVQAVGANNTVYLGALTNSNVSYGNDVGTIYVNTNGNVGINTTSATQKLTVNGITDTKGLYINGLHTLPNSTGAVDIQIASTSYNAIRFYDSNSTENHTIHGFSTNWSGGVSPGHLNLEGITATSFGTWVDPDMIVHHSNGNVGIGIGDSTPGAALHIERSTDATVLLKSTTNGNGVIYLEGPTRKWGMFAGSNSGKLSIKDETGTNELMTFTSGGSIGINTTDPKAQPHINSGGSYNNTDNNNRLFIEYNAGSPYILFSSPDERDQGIHFHNTTDNAFVGRIAYQHRSAGDKLWLRVGTSAGNGQFLFDSDGLKFNGDTAAANGLDDYEEGTFTPVVGDGTYTYTNRRGHYVKIGNMVYVHIGFRLATASPGTSTGTISGLPFTGINYGSYQEPHSRIAVGGALVTSNLSYNLSFYLSNSSSTLYARTSSGNADTPVASNAIWQAGTFIKYSLLYTVS